MEKFTRTLRGYDPDEVNRFLDQVISQVEDMVSELKEKNAKIVELQSYAEENRLLKGKIEQYERMTKSLNQAILVAQSASDQVKSAARKESESMLDEAKRNANRIVNEALMRAEKTEQEALRLKRNINVFKRRIKDIIEAQMEVIDEMEKVEL